jgi:AcrR family transcriptional regulator
MTRASARSTEAEAWSPREAEILAVTLELLQHHGYDGLTLHAVAAAARASKATVHRRWPTKAELVLAAVIHSIRRVAVAPETGSLRGDLMHLGEICWEQAQTHASTLRAVLVQASRNDALNSAVCSILTHQKPLIEHVIKLSVSRGEINPAAATITEDLWDMLPGYFIFRSIVSNRAPTRHVIQRLVDDVMIPSLTRSTDQHR